MVNEPGEKDEFEQGYAERSGVTVDFLHSMGQYAERCDCEDVTCKGWAMVNKRPSIDDDR